MQNETPYKHSVSPADGSSVEDIPYLPYPSPSKFLRFLGAGFCGLLLCALLISLEAGGLYWWDTKGLTKNDDRAVGAIRSMTIGLTMIVLMYTLPVSFFVSGTMAVTGKFGSDLYAVFIRSFVATAMINTAILTGLRTGMADGINIFLMFLIPLIFFGLLWKRHCAKYDRDQRFPSEAKT